MEGDMSKRLLPIFVVLFLASSLFGQETAKVSGVVTDAETGEPLPGANVIIQGTSYGAATDADGEYTILQIQPGLYTISASFIGYATLQKQEVQLTAGLTTRLNFELEAAAIEGQVIEVVVERPLVEPTATNAVRNLTREEFENMPTRSVATFYSIQSGVVQQNGEIHVRGGRSDETGYMLEGASTKSLLGADNVITTIPEALEQVNVQAGGYSAEMGNANAGIVQQTFRTGSENFSGSLQYETDALSESFGNTYSYGYNDLVATFGGPILSSDHRFFFAADNQREDDYIPRYWYGADFDTLISSGDGGVDAGTPSPGKVAWSDGNLPGDRPRFRDRLTLNGSLVFNFNPLRLRISGARTASENVAYNFVAPSNELYHIFNQDRIARREDLNQLFNLKASYFFSNTTFLEAQVSRFDYKFEYFDPNFDKPEADGKGGAVWDLMDYIDNAPTEIDGDPNALVEAGIDTSYYQGYYDAPGEFNFEGFRFGPPGTRETNYFLREQGYWNFKVDFVSQMENHELKFGGNFQPWLIREYQFAAFNTLGSQIAADPAFADKIRDGDPEVAGFIRRIGAVGYGYDEFMNEQDSGLFGPKKPFTASAYINDKIEYNDIIINAGLRYDLYNTDMWSPKDPADPGFDDTNFSLDENAVEESTPSGILQPRLGLAFPVTDRTVFHLQYGRFAQLPDLVNIYEDVPGMANIFSGQFFFSNPFGWDLDPVKTTQYEIGLQHQFTDFASFDVTAFYKNTFGQVEIVLQETNPNSAAADYNLFVNGDFATTRGFELTLRTRRVQGMMARLNYTLTDAKGTNSNPSGQVSALENGTAPPSIIRPLEYEQRHRGSMNIDYRTSPEYGQLLGDIGVNLLFTFNSGHRFTRSEGAGGQQGPDEGALLVGTDTRTRSPIEPINASTTPWFFNTDLRVEKGVSFGGFRAVVYGYVQNLFNTRNVINVYLRTGNAESDGYLDTPELSQDIVRNQGETYVDLYRAMNLENRQHYIDATLDDLYTTPREIRLGLRVEF
jgi:hypothetical protein